MVIHASPLISDSLKERGAENASRSDSSNILTYHVTLLEIVDYKDGQILITCRRAGPADAPRHTRRVDDPSTPRPSPPASRGLDVGNCRKHRPNPSASRHAGGPNSAPLMTIFGWSTPRCCSNWATRRRNRCTVTVPLLQLFHVASVHSHLRITLMIDSRCVRRSSVS